MPQTLEEALKEIETLKGKVTDLQTTVTQKDELIEQKNKDIVGARRKYTRLADLPAEEKAKMTDEEIAKKEEQDLLFESQEETRKQMEADRAKEVGERKANLAKKLAGQDPAIVDKVLKNFDRIKDAELAFTESEMEPFMNTALNMLGDERPSPVHAAINAGGGVAPVINGPEGEFAGSEAGKSVATDLGLSFVNEGGDNK